MIRSLLLFGVAALFLSGCDNSARKAVIEKLPQEQTAVFVSTDKHLENTYNWARKMALSYAHDGTDPVGYWYEAALPQREAFCMRDVSHQSVGAQILGLAEHNKNMFRKFAENISESKDWCTYWEINRYDKPAPADYTNDKEFWYNLNANFDVIQACWKMYEWTGDKDYLTDSCFVNFYNKSLNDYIVRWSLQPENVMSRPRYMNQPENFDLNNNFHTCRGLASYVENFRGLTMGVDLIATLYVGFDTSSKMASLLGNKGEAEKHKRMALEYRDILEREWWCEDSAYYQTFWTEDRTFHRGEGVPFILWFGATENKDRIQASVKDILSKEWNVENLSAFPALLYRLGYFKEAYNYLTELPQMNRSEYPEVSYGVIEGTVCGVMGVIPSASEKQISTCSRLVSDSLTTEIKNLPVFGGYVTVKHTGCSVSEIENNTSLDLVWKAAFMGKYPQIEINGKLCQAAFSQDIYGNVYSVAEVKLPSGKKMHAQVPDTKDR